MVTKSNQLISPIGGFREGIVVFLLPLWIVLGGVMFFLAFRQVEWNNQLGEGEWIAVSEEIDPYSLPKNFKQNQLWTKAGPAEVRFDEPFGNYQNVPVFLKGRWEVIKTGGESKYLFKAIHVWVKTDK